jgi:hypothetical protein
VTIDQYREARAGVDIEAVAMGYRTVRLLPLDELQEAQAGYAGEGWFDDWLVIATEDELGDPIFADLGSSDLYVSTAMHGVGQWEPVRIADSFSGFVASLRCVAAVAEGREYPVALEDNPLPESEAESVLSEIRRLNPRSDMEFWESWLALPE